MKVWHFTYIGDETIIGEGTSIGSLAHIDHHVRIGRNCRIQGMVYLPPGTVIGDNVFIGPGVILTYDRARVMGFSTRTCLPFIKALSAM